MRLRAAQRIGRTSQWRSPEPEAFIGDRQNASTTQVPRLKGSCTCLFLLCQSTAASLLRSYAGKITRSDWFPESSLCRAPCAQLSTVTCLHTVHSASFTACSQADYARSPGRDSAPGLSSNISLPSQGGLSLLSLAHLGYSCCCGACKPDYLCIEGFAQSAGLYTLCLCAHVLQHWSGCVWSSSRMCMVCASFALCMLAVALCCIVLHQWSTACYTPPHQYLSRR